VGERVPDFTLSDPRGRPRSLASLMGEKICHRPQSVPLTWTIAVKPLDTGRVNRQ
jgi:hypothetical protein